MMIIREGLLTKMTLKKSKNGPRVVTKRQRGGILLCNTKVASFELTVGRMGDQRLSSWEIRGMMYIGQDI